MGWRTSFIAALLLLASAGCWSRTRSLTAAQADRGEVGFGASAHTHIAYMVLAAAVATITATGNVAMVDDAEAAEIPTDSLWQAYDGGREIRHCFVVKGGRHVCADAELDDSIGWGKSLVFVDPINLGRFLSQVQATATDGRNQYYIYAQAGSVSASSDNRMALGPGHGVWGVVAGDNTVMHCQLEKSTPRCRQLPPDSDGLVKITLLDAVLGVFSNPREDILWIGKPTGVFRCTATPAQPAPKCVAARMQ